MHEASARGRSIFGKYLNAHLNIYDIWPQASMYVNTLLQCSPASVGLAQARSNKDIWEAAIREELPYGRETRNTKDRYAIAVKIKAQ